MKTLPTTFIFDCFGVLCSPILSTWYKENSLKHGFVDENLLRLFRRFDLNELSEDEVLEYFSKYKGVESTINELRDEIDSYLYLDTKLVALIKTLKEKGFKTALLSNANNAFFERKIYKDYPEFKSLFDEIIISSLVGMVKPDAEIYVHALEKIHSKPEESLFVDDNASNVDAAIKLGIKGYVYTDCASFVNYLKEIGVEVSK